MAGSWIYFLGNLSASITFSLIGCYFGFGSFLFPHESRVTSLITFFSLLAITWVLILQIQELWPLISKLYVKGLSYFEDLGGLIALVVMVGFWVTFPSKIRIKVSLRRSFYGPAFKQFTVYKSQSKDLKSEDLPPDLNLSQEEIKKILDTVNGGNYSKFYSDETTTYVAKIIVPTADPLEKIPVTIMVKGQDNLILKTVTVYKIPNTELRREDLPLGLDLTQEEIKTALDSLNGNNFSYLSSIGQYVVTIHPTKNQRKSYHLNLSTGFKTIFVNLPPGAKVVTREDLPPGLTLEQTSFIMYMEEYGAEVQVGAFDLIVPSLDGSRIDLTVYKAKGYPVKREYLPPNLSQSQITKILEFVNSHQPPTPPPSISHTLMRYPGLRSKRPQIL